MAVDTRAEPAPKAAGRPGAVFEWGALLTASWVVLGAHLDAWAHNHGKTDETFFTQWHALLYFGMFCTMAYLGIAMLRGVRKGLPWRNALPQGYLMALCGALGFGLFGVVDLVWHEVFGVESDTAALFSPSHLGLMVSAFLIAAGPMTAARSRGDSVAGPRTVISAGLALSMIWFWAEFDLPHSSLWVARFESDEGITQGVYAIVVATATIMGFLLYLMRDFKLRPGSVTVLVAFPAMLTVGIIGPEQPQALHLSVLAGGVLGDLILLFVGTTGIRIRLVAIAIPAAFWSVYFAVVAATYGLEWVVHVWTGAIVVSALTGLLVSLLVLPSRVTR